MGVCICDSDAQNFTLEGHTWKSSHWVAFTTPIKWATNKLVWILCNSCQDAADLFLLLRTRFKWHVFTLWDNCTSIRWAINKLVWGMQLCPCVLLVLCNVEREEMHWRYICIEDKMEFKWFVFCISGTTLLERIWGRKYFSAFCQGLPQKVLKIQIKWNASLPLRIQLHSLHSAGLFILGLLRCSWHAAGS